MTTPNLRLYHSPGACSQVSVFALEQAGLAYELELVNLAQNAQADPAYRAISPLSKVPTLLIDGETLTENAAIQTYAASLRPDSGLFPTDPSPRMRAEIVGGLSFCGGTLHPIVRGIVNPSRITSGDGALVREKSVALAIKTFSYAESRISERGWWLGERSSIDVYLNWNFRNACRVGFDGSAYPALSSLYERLLDWSGFARMVEIERSSREALGIPG